MQDSNNLDKIQGQNQAVLIQYQRLQAKSLEVPLSLLILS